VPNKCLISNTIQMRRPHFWMRAAPSSSTVGAGYLLGRKKTLFAHRPVLVTSRVGATELLNHKRNISPSPSVVDSVALLPCLLIIASEGSIND
jgi:hypothetical protein